MRIALVGEALIDFTGTGTGPLAFQGHHGGGTLNTAVGCAMLGAETGFIACLSNDLFGEQLLQFLQRTGIDTRFVTRDDAPSTLAFVERTASTNRYAFYLRGSSTTQWSPAALPVLPDSCRFLQFGSISLLMEPTSSRITEFVKMQGEQRIVVFDPNVRPSVIDDMAAYRDRFRAWLRSSHVLKLSDEDVEALCPGDDAELAMQRFLDAGPRVVLLTRGADGATLYRRGARPIDVRPPKITVVDTIGAGDIFTAGVMVRMGELGVGHPAQLAALSDEAWLDVLQFAATAAAINCTREGCDPPRRQDVVRLNVEDPARRAHASLG